jgi:DNA-binding GntR family transcriptional regulator
MASFSPTTSNVLAPVESSSLVDVVTERIREAIVRGRLRPGARLSEPALAEQMKVSRSPVRAALQTLEQEGLISRQPNRSPVVWQPTEADVTEILSLRTMLESLAAELTIPTLDDQAFAEMEAIVERQRQAIEENDHLRLIHLDKEFHEYLCRRSGHSRLLDWWRQIMGQWEVLVYMRVHHDLHTVVPTILTDHADLLGALRRRDLGEVVSLHRSINERVRDHIINVLRLVNGSLDGTSAPAAEPNDS